MRKTLTVGLSSWVIQDGNYRDFRRDAQVAFALEFYSPNGLLVVEDHGPAASLEHLHGSTYRVVGKVIHVRESEWWAIDTGVLMYREEKPPPGVKEGSWVTGEVHIGVDPFFYFERLSRHHAAPALIYDWVIRKIEIQTAPFIKSHEGHAVRDPARQGWPEIDATNAWSDGVGAEYDLHCERLPTPPRR